MTQRKHHPSFHHSKRHTQSPIEVNIGDRFPLTIKKLGVEGQGIGYFKHKVCFVPGAIPNDVIVAEVTKVHEKYLEATIHRLKKPSAERVIPKDDYAMEAGGFEFENLAYPAQLRYKRQMVIDSLAKFKPLGYRHYEVRPTIASEYQYEYRNKAQFQIRNQNGKVVAGLYKSGTHEVVDMETCAVQMPGIMKIMRALVDQIEQLNIPLYDEANHSGILKTIVIRESMATHEFQVTFVTNSPKLLKKHQLITFIQSNFPEVVSIMQNINPGDTPLIWGNEMLKLAGKNHITESLMGLDFLLSARSFLQLNPYQTETLYEEAAKAMELGPDDTLVDAYAGIGTIGLSLASRVKQVVGMETIPESVADANQNAQLNDITNARYEVGSAEELLPKWRAEGLHFDALVVDPPRTGLDAKLIEQILEEKPAKFAYVSCNLASLARNLARLVPTYHVDYIQPVDMMPQTPRCEAVVKLSSQN